MHRERERFVSLALTIIRAYIMAACPAQNLKPLGSYGAWTQIVRNALVWLGQPDPATAVYNRKAEDSDREILDRMLLAWKAAFGSSTTAVRDALKHIDSLGSNKPSRAELAELFRDVAKLKGEVNRNRLGRWIARHQGRIAKGLKFTRDTPAGGSERWSIKGVTGVSGDMPGGATESVSSHAEVGHAIEVFP